MISSYCIFLSLDESLPNDLKKAKKDFLSAMDAFMQISRIISQSAIKVVNTSDKIDRDLSSEIDRLEKYVKTLETISKKYNINVTNDFIEFII